MRSNPELIAVETAGKSVLRKLLKLGLDQGLVWPAFQPIVDIRSGNVASFEVLARWSHPGIGEISPMTFIPRLEQYGLIDTLSEALMGRACCAAAHWPGHCSLAFNISPVQLIREDFPRRLAELVAATGFPLTRVELEVTEGSLISDDDRAYKILRELNDLGVKIGIDDFGTGYSNLARLESFPFHKLKIDRRFVSNLDAEPGKRRIAAAVIGLGQSLGITVVAEGVETAAEESILRNLGCDLGQGWHYGKGEPADQAQRKLKRRGGANSYGRPLDISPFQQFHQLASLYNQSPAGLCFVDMNFRHVRANDRFASIYGLTGAELEGKTVFDLVEGEQLETLLEVVAESAVTDKPITQNYVFRRRDIRIISTRVLDLGGDVMGYSLVSIDVTEENRLKTELVESEYRLRKELNYAEAIIRSLPGVFYHYDEEMRLRRWNQNYEKVTGFTSEELQDRHPLESIGDEDRGRVASAMEQVFVEGHAQIEANFVTRDGQRKPYFFTGTRLEHEGRTSFVGTGTDISEQKNMQRALREKTVIFEAMVHTAPDGILLLAPDGKRIIQNRLLNELWKIPEEIASDPDSRRQLEFITRQVKNPVEFADKNSWLRGHPDAVSFDDIELLDGTILKCYTAPLCDDEGCHYGRVWAFRNTTEEEKAGAPFTARSD